MRAIINGKIITEDELLENKAIIFDKKILEIADKCELKKFDLEEIIDAENNYVSPGLIDLHIHGSGGKDTMDGEIESIKVISNTICKNGVTAFLPTTMTMSKENIYNAFSVVRECMNLDLGGAKVIGAHMEGPFLDENYKGAQNADYIINPDFNFIKGFEDVIKIITLAPEKDKENEFIKKVKKETDIVLSIGHTNATYEEAISSIVNGVSHATHTFNAMTPLNHRKPGVVGAIFNTDVSCEIIADKIHVHKAIFNILVKVKGKDKIILITDSMQAGCMQDGVWELGGQKVIVKEGSARLEDGTLAGSILTLNKAIKNILENTNLQVWEVVAMASINPARDIKIDHKKGSIDIGKDADIIILDSAFNVRHTIIEGKTVFKC
ncbi:N-acetylglucosamine-6-phosphate deacetylase [Clostridium lundense]|uniref:N-acetylglucosamine-6-phosphate deacetylase n=1 Tax=Clostridium lundense TaxID=319475 RepID=UPI0004876279|nr:N-acetylglucosamine-6-phosphate deacetylase [Clostridium lundense]